jgi:hypothetical protein
VLKTGLDYANFLTKYLEFVKELLDQFDYKIMTMNARIDDENRNYEEVTKLRLKMDKSKFTALVGEYRANLARFQRRRDKIAAVEATIRSEYAALAGLVGEFGRELAPLE